MIESKSQWHLLYNGVHPFNGFYGLENKGKTLRKFIMKKMGIFDI